MMSNGKTKAYGRLSGALRSIMSVIIMQRENDDDNDEDDVSVAVDVVVCWLLWRVTIAIKYNNKTENMFY